MRRSSRILAAMLIGASTFGVAGAQAAVVSFEFDTHFAGGSGPTSTPWLTATFDDGGTPGSVELTLSTSGLTDNEFVSKWYFNLEPFQSINFTHLSGVAPTGTSSGEDAFKAGGDGYFDILIQYATTAVNRFGAGLESVLLLEAAGLTAEMFNAMSLGGGLAKDGFLVAAHVQGGLGGGSSWVTTGDEGEGPSPTPIPIMGALPLLLSALGLLGFAGGWWRRRAAA